VSDLLTTRFHNTFSFSQKENFFLPLVKTLTENISLVFLLAQVFFL